METKKRQPRKKAKKWSEMTYEERRAALPEKLNKYGEWLLKDDSEKDFIVINDMRAVLK
ncbi:MAG: hypothetical protein LUI04_07030 [Porphyromonadaceae bacterium]|nr:hypothetical protein [Porphyromonadaceae bacterium]